MYTMHLIVKWIAMVFLIKKQNILKKNEQRIFSKQNKNMPDMTVRHQKTLPHVGLLKSFATTKCSDISI